MASAKVAAAGAGGGGGGGGGGGAWGGGAGEVCAVPGAGPPAELPRELFELGPGGLGAVLSLESWEDALSEEERAGLRKLLPGEGRWRPEREERPGGLLGELLGGGAVRFGANPGTRLWKDMQAGRCTPDVVEYQAARRDLEWRQYVHSVRAYHDGMVARLRRLHELIGAEEGGAGGVMSAEKLQAVLEAWRTEMGEVLVEEQEPREGGAEGGPQVPRAGAGGRRASDPDHELAALTQKVLVETLSRDKRELVSRMGSKSVPTIPESSPEERALYREEEARRYESPETAFRFTSRDGEPVSVAPLQLPGSKAPKMRPHALLIKKRSPAVTILSLVRDACARFPAGVGTRADLCILFRDTQYLVEDADLEQVSQCVGSAMDRLRYQKDSCVSYNLETRMWTYLHKERNEGDFAAAAAATATLTRLEKQRAELEARLAGLTGPLAGLAALSAGKEMGGAKRKSKKRSSPGKSSPHGGDDACEREKKRLKQDPEAPVLRTSRRGEKRDKEGSRQDPEAPVGDVPAESAPLLEAYRVYSLAFDEAKEVYKEGTGGKCGGRMNLASRMFKGVKAAAAAVEKEWGKLKEDSGGNATEEEEEASGEGDEGETSE